VIPQPSFEDICEKVARMADSGRLALKEKVGLELSREEDQRVDEALRSVSARMVLEQLRDEDGNPAPRVPLARNSSWRQMLEWNVPDKKVEDEKVQAADMLATEIECAKLADEILEKLMLYHAKYEHAMRIRGGEDPIIPTRVDAAILRLVDIVTKDEECLSQMAFLSKVMGSIPEECCVEALWYFYTEGDGKKSEPKKRAPATDSRAGCDSL
jgi:hypothetical protein